jgi:hypothetical protein
MLHRELTTHFPFLNCGVGFGWRPFLMVADAAS